MRQRTDALTNAHAAAFALFEGLRGAQGLPLAPASAARLTCVGAVDLTSCGLHWAAEGDAGLQLEVVPSPGAQARPMWLHAAADDRGPTLTAYVRRDRPALAIRFGGLAFLPAGGGRHRLRERPTFPSSDPRHADREAAVKRLARAWDVALDGPWLVVGEWDALEGAWDPEAVRRFAALAWILEAARA